MRFAVSVLGFLLLASCGSNARVENSEPSPPAPTVEKKIDAAAFLKSIVGEYDILEAGPPGGAMKPFPGYVGTVELSDGEIGLTFPYCPPGEGCLPGYAYFQLTSATAVEAGGTVTFTATLDDDSKGRFRWTAKDGKITFVNELLQHSDGKRKPVEYHLRKR